MRVSKNVRRALLRGGAVSALIFAIPSAPAQERPLHEFSLEAQDLGNALRSLSRQAGEEIMFAEEVVAGKSAPRLEGRYTTEEAVRLLIANSGLVADFRKDGILIGGRFQAADPIETGTAPHGDILVTGTRLARATIASTVITLSRNQMMLAGQSDLTQVIASIPQNFNGGQNPGLGFGVPLTSGENVGSGSSINLRGLGQDATLTLVNGHRLAYGGYRQSVDVSSIPLAAVERIEIVPDGASAIYGSDAVAGVANVILRKGVSGIEAAATVGTSTDGGNTAQQYSLLGGTNWSSGRMTLAYEFGTNTAIDARQRSYTYRTNPGLTLYPALSHHNIVAIGSQNLTDDIRLSIDALANWRSSENAYSLDGLSSSPYFDISSDHFSLSVAPSLDLRINDKWRVTVAGTYGLDEVNSATDQVLGATITPQLRSCFCNSSWSLETGVSGGEIELPGGPLQVATGIGIRSNSLHALRTVGGARDVQVSQRARYAYGEIGIPLVGEAMHVPLIRRLSLSAAVRYEDYPGIDRVTTPKLGMIFEAFRGLEFRGSWGKSFKAPTLFQLYGDQGISLRRASTAGGSSLPAGATILLRSGGNPQLQPERATTWSLGMVAQPAAISGLRLEVSYYHVVYRDRIVLPIAFLSQALTNPIYSDYVTMHPTAAEQADAIAGLTLLNLAGAPYNPANVAAIIRYGNTNAAEQRARGLDFLASYDRRTGPRSSLNLTANVSYLKSLQKLISRQPTLPLSGILYNPPSWRGRVGGIWSLDDTTVALFGNYVGGLRDTRVAPFVPVPSVMTADLSVSQRVRSRTALLDGITVRLAAQNFFNAQPPTIATNLVYTPAYDTTNYSALGRVVSLSLSQKF